MRERFLETGAKDKSSIYMQTLYPLSACTYRYSGVFGAVADRRSIQGRAGSSKEGREWCFLSFLLSFSSKGVIHIGVSGKVMLPDGKTCTFVISFGLHVLDVGVEIDMTIDQSSSESNASSG